MDGHVTAFMEEKGGKLVPKLNIKSVLPQPGSKISSFIIADAPNFTSFLSKWLRTAALLVTNVQCALPPSDVRVITFDVAVSNEPESSKAFFSDGIARPVCEGDRERGPLYNWLIPVSSVLHLTYRSRSNPFLFLCKYIVTLRSNRYTTLSYASL